MKNSHYKVWGTVIIMIVVILLVIFSVIRKGPVVPIQDENPFVQAYEPSPVVTVYPCEGDIKECI